MNGPVFYSAGGTAALAHAVQRLQQHGCIFASKPGNDVTHILLDIPSFASDGSLRGGGDISAVLQHSNRNVVVIGGNLHHPALADYKTIDLLKNPLYLAENADITAHCAIKIAMNHLPVVLKGCQVLVVGWGRIGKCLAALLKQMGAIVTVAARKESDRAILSACGYDVEDASALGYSLVRYRVIFNTVPSMVLPADALQHCQPACLKIDLASDNGIDASDVIRAKGLPNKETPETSGTLIARSILRLIQGGVSS